MKRILELGYGGKPLGRHYSLDFRGFAKRLPRDLEYHGVDFVCPFRSVKDHEAEIQSIAERCDERNGRSYGGLEHADIKLLKDVSVSIAEARSMLAGSGAERIFLHTMDARSLSFSDGAFDEIHMHYFVTHAAVWPFIWDIMSEAYRVLKIGGHMILTGENGHSFFHEGDHFLFLAFMKNDAHTLHAMETAGFEFLHIGPGYPEASLIRTSSLLHEFLLERLEEASRAYLDSLKAKGALPGLPGTRFRDEESMFIVRKPEGTPCHAMPLEGEVEPANPGWRGYVYITGWRYRSFLKNHAEIVEDLSHI